MHAPMPRADLLVAETAALLLVTGALVAAVGQQPAAPPAPLPKPLVPLAASSLATEPDGHYGEYVSLMGAVEKRWSKTVFSVDQDPTGRGSARVPDVLVIAPALGGDLVPNSYVTVIGDVIRFDPAEISQRAKDYVLDIAADVIEQYRGRPAVLATSVITASMIDLAKKLPPPMTAEEEAFSKVMKRVGPAFNALRQGAGGPNAETVRDNASVLKQAFAEVEKFWKNRGRADALGWAQDARKHVEGLDRAAASSDWDAVKSSTATLGQTCQSCHTAYRERFDDGSFRIKKDK
jgi:cytochrome c556